MKTNRSSQVHGFTLIEIMVSMVILIIVVLGTNSLLYHVGAGVAVQNNKRAAIETANRRLEELYSVPYNTLRSGVGSHYVCKAGDGSFYLSGNNPDETISINGSERSIVTTVERHDLHSPDGEYVRITVRVQYRSGDNWVTLAANRR